MEKTNANISLDMSFVVVMEGRYDVEVDPIRFADFTFLVTLGTGDVLTFEFDGGMYNYDSNYDGNDTTIKIDYKSHESLFGGGKMSGHMNYEPPEVSVCDLTAAIMGDLREIVEVCIETIDDDARFIAKSMTIESMVFSDENGSAEVSEEVLKSFRY